MPNNQPKDNLHLTSEELDAQDVAHPPNREAMSVISPSPIPISASPADLTAIPTTDGQQMALPSQDGLSDTATGTADTATSTDPPEQEGAYSPHQTSVDQT